jgi:hypothetical protein
MSVPQRPNRSMVALLAYRGSKATMLPSGGGGEP